MERGPTSWTTLSRTPVDRGDQLAVSLAKPCQAGDGWRSRLDSERNLTGFGVVRRLVVRDAAIVVRIESP